MIRENQTAPLLSTGSHLQLPRPRCAAAVIIPIQGADMGSAEAVQQFLLIVIPALILVLIYAPTKERR